MGRLAIRNVTLIQRFSILCGVTLILFCIALGRIITGTLEHNELTRAKRLTAIIVSEEVRKEFTAADLNMPKTGSDYEDFFGKVNHLSFGPDIERIKIWNKNRVVVWSDDKRLIGRQFPDNDDLDKAFNDEIISEITKLDKTEQKFEHQFETLLEIYVPIRFEARGDIETVFEIYRNLDPLYVDIARHRRSVWIFTSVGFVLLYLVLFALVWRASRRIEAQGKDIMRSEMRYRGLVQSALDGIISIDRSSKVTLFNKAAEQIFDCPAEEVMGQSLEILIPENFRAKHLSGMNRFLETGKTTFMGKTVELEGLRRNGEIFPLELSLSVSGEGENLIITGILRDISERRAIQEQLINTEKQASIGIIAGSIGHEIKNAITGLLGYAEFLRIKPGDREVALKCSEIFSSQSQRLALHGNNLQALSKPRKPELKPVALNLLLDRVTELLSVSGLLKAYTLAKEYSEDLPAVIGDEILLEQVIRNLEINAAHAMGNMGILKLGTRFSEDKSHIEFSIIDTGHGIPDDKRNQIFLPFYTTKEKGEGTGLGLYIVKQIVDQHNGYIQLKSEVGVGTTVSVGLPIARG